MCAHAALLDAGGGAAPGRGRAARARAELRPRARRGTVAQWDEDTDGDPERSSLGDDLRGAKIAVPDAAAADLIVVTASRAAGTSWSTPPTSRSSRSRPRHHAAHGDGAARRAPRDGALRRPRRGRPRLALDRGHDRGGVRRPRPARDGDGGRLRQGPHPVRPPDRHVPGGLPRLRADAARGRGRAQRRAVGGVGARQRARVGRLAPTWRRPTPPTARARVTASSLQVHGGIGFTWEHDLHFFLKRAQANAHAYGDARWHRDELAAALFD